MALTFSDLRDTNNQSLALQDTRLRDNEELLETAEGKTRLQVQGRIRHARGRTEDLLTHREDIEALANSQSQKITYGGVEKWHTDFILLRDFHTHSNVTYEGQLLRNHVWSHVPNSRFKRFQELFVQPEHLAVPPFQIARSGAVNFGSVNFNTLSLRGCLVSADRIPDKLATDLKLCDFTEENGDPFARLAKKKNVIPELKKLWESTRLLQPGHHRLLAIEEPAADIESLHPGTKALDPAIFGTLLYVREYENSNGASSPSKKDPPAPRHLVVQHHESMYSAHRKTGREEMSYMREMEQLIGMLGDIRQLNTRVNEQWKNSEMRTELRESVRTVGVKCIKQLGECENKYKVDAKDFIAEFIELKDSSGKDNVSAALSKMVGAINRFDTRLEQDMDRKGSYNYRDRKTLERIIKAQEKALYDYALSVVDGANRLTSSALLNPCTPMNPSQIATNVQGLEGRLNLAPDDRLSYVRLQPFRAYRDKLGLEYAGLHARLQGRDRDGAADQMIKLHVIGKFQQVRTCFERMKECTMDAEHISISRIRAFVTTLRRLFAAPRIFPDRPVSSFEEPFEKICQDLKKIDDRLAFYEGENPDVSSRTVIYKALKKYLETFDIEEIVRSLS